MFDGLHLKGPATSEWPWRSFTGCRSFQMQSVQHLWSILHDFSWQCDRTVPLHYQSFLSSLWWISYSARNIKIEKWQVTNNNDMYCHLKPPTRCHCELKNFWASVHQRLNFDGSIYIRYAVPPYSAGTIIVASVYGKWIKLLPNFSPTSIVLSRWQPSQNKQEME